MSGHENKSFMLAYTYFRPQHLQKLLFRDMIITSIPYKVSRVLLYYTAPFVKEEEEEEEEEEEAEEEEEMPPNCGITMN